LRAAKIGKKFGLNYILKGNGNEFERIEEIKKQHSKFIIQLTSLKRMMCLTQTKPIRWN
jgi:hypothetical protein